MNISAVVTNRPVQHTAVVRTGDKEQYLSIPAKSIGSGSAVNGGELLFLALATCYCNDLYREAAERGIEIQAVEVEVSGQFGGKGEPAKEIRYRAAVKADCSSEDMLELMRYTDTVAEIHNTLRCSVPVVLADCSVLDS